MNETEEEGLTLKSAARKMAAALREGLKAMADGHRLM
jgi:hypothetical protein